MCSGARGRPLTVRVPTRPQLPPPVRHLPSCPRCLGTSTSSLTRLPTAKEAALLAGEEAVPCGRAGPQTQLCHPLALAGQQEARRGQLAQLLPEAPASPLRCVCPGLSNASTERRAGLSPASRAVRSGAAGPGPPGLPPLSFLCTAVSHAAPHSALRLPRRPHRPARGPSACL